MNKRTPTEQQEKCITAICSAIQMLKIEACAGSGKTSTLTMMAQASEVPSLYLAFNKVTATEASQKFPRHVTCRTTHSIAYAAFGAKMSAKLSRPKGGYVNVAGTGSEIARFFSIDSYENKDGVTITNNFMGLLTRDTVARFEQSADETIMEKHVPTLELKQKLGDNPASMRYVVSMVQKYAKILWEARTNLASPVLATHDTYLKLYQLSKPALKGYDVIYVDEFQDTTPCVLDIIMNQRKTSKIVMVGDNRQAIYGWRGAVNAMRMARCDTFYLTKSFRYGQAVADIATTVLERDMQIEGNSSIPSVVALNGVIDPTKPYTRLFRSNAALLAEAVNAIIAGDDIRIEIDIKDFVKLLQSTVALFHDDMRNVKHEKLLAYTSWDEMLEESKSDPELGRVAKVVKDGNAAMWIEILQMHVNSPTAHVTFTTAHKSKGREWSQVRIENDFKSCFNDDGEWIGLSTEEQNLLYVAVTRAIDVLEYNNTVREYLNEQKSHELPVNVRKVMQGMSSEIGMGGGDYLRGDMAIEAAYREDTDFYQLGRPDSILAA